MLRILILSFCISFCIVSGCNCNIWNYDDYQPDINPNSFKLSNKKFYLEIYFKANYFEAIEFCRYHGMNLATIYSKEENDKLVIQKARMGFSGESLWLSGSDLGHEGKFIWMTTGAPLLYTNFDVGQPDNYKGNENCLEVWGNNKWNDGVCEFKKYFACEYY